MTAVAAVPSIVGSSAGSGGGAGGGAGGGGGRDAEAAAGEDNKGAATSFSDGKEPKLTKMGPPECRLFMPTTVPSNGLKR